MRRAVMGALLVAIATVGIACGHTGFVPLSEPAPAASPAQPLPIYAARDVGRPYRVLGYVFRSTEGHKSGLERVDDTMHVMSHASEEIQEMRREALARGADAVVGFEMFPTLSGFGQPVGFSVGGLAVKFLDAPTEPPVVPPTPSASPEAATEPPSIAPIPSEPPEAPTEATPPLP